MTAAIRRRQWPLMTRLVPQVASWRPFAAATAIAATLILLAPNPAAASMRLRIGAAIMAASIAFALDDTAAATLASSPMTRLARRSVRVVSALVALGVSWVGLAVFADALTGSGYPPLSAALEMGAIAALALAASAVACHRSDDDSGGIAGLGVALGCFATSYLPDRWWWPLAADPASPAGIRRLLGVLTVAGLLGVVASLDPARRRGRL